jgi:hypothetical protein
MQTPVVFMVFNRPDLTAQVFQEIAKARPPVLFVIADGPRPHQSGDIDKCAAARAVTVVPEPVRSRVRRWRGMPDGDAATNRMRLAQPSSVSHSV